MNRVVLPSHKQHLRVIKTYAHRQFRGTGDQPLNLTGTPATTALPAFCYEPQPDYSYYRRSLSRYRVHSKIALDSLPTKR
jgi:hypothetical protein